MGKLVRRDSSSSTTGPCASFASTAADQSRWPVLVEFLASSSWPDGLPRRPGTLLLFVDEGRLKACLSDRDQELVLFVTAYGLVEALDGAEQALQDPKADWRKSRNAGQGRARR